LRNRLYKGLTSRLTETYVNGSLEHRLPGNLNIRSRSVEGESLLMALKDVAYRRARACTSASLEPSYVLRALGVGDELAHTSIRFGHRPVQHRGRDRLCDRAGRRERRATARAIPALEMHQDGIDINSIQWTPH